MKMFFDPRAKSFLNGEFEARYRANGKWPAQPIRLTETEYREFSAQPPDGKVLSSGEDGRPEWADAPPKALAPVDQLAERALSRINSGYQAEMGQILNDYPQAETLTFDKQEREARQWQADNSVATPYIDAMLAERPLDKAELVGRILAKADAFTLASGMATGKRQRLEDDVKAALAAEDRAALEAIDW